MRHRSLVHYACFALVQVDLYDTFSCFCVPYLNIPMWVGGWICVFLLWCMMVQIDLVLVLKNSAVIIVYLIALHWNRIVVKELSLISFNICRRPDTPANFKSLMEQYIFLLKGLHVVV